MPVRTLFDEFKYLFVEFNYLILLRFVLLPEIRLNIEYC